MPPELVEVLQRVRDLLAVAMLQGGLWAQRRALFATGALMLAAVHEGWQRVEIVRTVGVSGRRSRNESWPLVNAAASTSQHCR